MNNGNQNDPADKVIGIAIFGACVTIVVLGAAIGIPVVIALWRWALG